MLKYIIILVLFLVGCGSLPTIPRGHYSAHGRAVEFHTSGTRDKIGMGAVIGKNTAITAFHIVELNTSYWIKPYAVLQFRAQMDKLCPSSPESIAVLKLNDNTMFKGWNHQDIFSIDSDNDEPVKVITGRGCFFWEHYVPEPGDSGSPVVDKDGELVGLVYGWNEYTDNVRKPIMIRIPAECLKEK